VSRGAGVNECIRSAASPISAGLYYHVYFTAAILARGLLFPVVVVVRVMIIVAPCPCR
jgi:hypothetical protein